MFRSAVRALSGVHPSRLLLLQKPPPKRGARAARGAPALDRADRESIIRNGLIASSKALGEADVRSMGAATLPDKADVGVTAAAAARGPPRLGSTSAEWLPILRKIKFADLSDSESSPSFLQVCERDADAIADAFKQDPTINFKPPNGAFNTVASNEDKFTNFVLKLFITVSGTPNIWPSKAKQQHAFRRHRTGEYLQAIASMLADSDQTTLLPSTFTIADLCKLAAQAQSNGSSFHSRTVTEFPDPKNSLAFVVRTCVPDAPVKLTNEIPGDDTSTCELYCRHVTSDKWLVIVGDPAEKYVPRAAVHVYAGSSGSGKTCGIVTDGATVHEPLPVFFFKSSHIVRRADSESLSAADWMSLPKARKTARDDRTVNAIVASVKESVQAMKEVVYRPQDGLERSGARARIAIDEVGSYPSLTRAVISAQDEIRRRVGEVLGVKPAAVEIFIAGTGSASPKEAFGSASDTARFHVVDMDKRADKFEDFFLDQHPKHVKAVLRGTGWSEVDRAAYRALLRCARLGALSVRWMKAMGEQKQREVHADSTPVALAAHLKQTDATSNAPIGTVKIDPPGSVKHLIDLATVDISTWFRTRNGLANKTDDDLREILANALAVDVGRFDVIEDNETRTNLVTTYGVLRDRAVHIPRGEVPSWYRIIDPVSDPSSKTVLAVPNDALGRYEMPAQYRSMFLALSLGDARLATTSAGDWSGLEHLTWKWLAVLQTCVTKERTLHDLVDLLCAEHVVGAGMAGGTDDADRLRACYAPYTDPTRGFSRVFTGRLIKDAAITSGVLKNGNAAPPASSNVRCLRSDDRFPFDQAEKARDLIQPHLLPLEAKWPTGISVLNLKDAPYADVGAYMCDASGKLWSVLAQCKLRTEFPSPQVDFEKMHCLTPERVGVSKISIRKMHSTMRRRSQKPALFLFAVAGPQAPTAGKLTTCPTQAVNDIKSSVVHFATERGSVAESSFAVVPLACDRNKATGACLKTLQRRTPFYPLFVQHLPTEKEVRAAKTTASA